MTASTPAFTLHATLHGISPLTAVTAALANLGIGYTIEPSSTPPVQATQTATTRTTRDTPALDAVIECVQVEPRSVAATAPAPTFHISPAAIQSAARILLDADANFSTRSIGALTKHIATTYGAPVTPALTTDVQHAVEQDNDMAIVRRQSDGAPMYRRRDTYMEY